MNNVGPVNGAHQMKTGHEFVNELFASDNEEEEEEDQQRLDEAEYYRDQTSITDNGMIDREDSGALNPFGEQAQMKSSKKNVKFPKEQAEFKLSSHNIILNLSKYTLRNIIMLLCDEAVSGRFVNCILKQKFANCFYFLTMNTKGIFTRTKTS